MKTIKTILLLSILYLCHGSALAQDMVANKWSLQFNLQHQDLPLDISFGQLGVVHDVSFRPYYSLDIQRAFYKNPRHQFLLYGRVGHYNHLYHYKWLSLGLGIGYEARIWKGLFASIRLETARVRVQRSDPQYTLENEKWVVAKNYQPANWHLKVLNRVDLGYRVLEGRHPL
ncbi:MAG: hypothetical protein AAFO94_01935, partial [Bacteroidota bacterium]